MPTLKAPRWPALTLTLLFASVLGPVSAARALPTQNLKGEVLDEKNAPIPSAVCTLTGSLLPQEGLSATTDEKGEFQFLGLVPGSYALTCAAVGYEPVFKSGIEVTEAQAPYVQMVLPPEIVVREKVEVREKAPEVAQGIAAPPATLSSRQLASLPLVQQKFKAALPLVPGVVRTPDGKINIKGAVESQGLLLVDSAESVDPVTGSFSIEIPIDAVQSLEVFKSAYRAEYGRFSGGLTSVETKPPSNQFHFELNDFLPTPRIKSGHIVGIADDQPRLYITGPLLANKLSFSESIAYDLTRQPVRGLPFPHNETKTEGFNSFTSFQYVFTPQHLTTVNVDVFPRRRQFANINSLVPQSASSDYGQRGFSAGTTDRYLLSSGGILTTLFQFTKFDSYGHGQGPQDMLITPNGWGGNFFNSFTRASNQQEFRQSYQFPRLERRGKHDLKVGVDFLRRSYTEANRSQPVLLLRPDGSVAERIDFTGPASLAAKDTELALFVEDHWTFNEHLGMDTGLRYSRQTVGERAAFAPRLGVVYSPGDSGKTILRSGVGIFFDRVPLLAGDFNENASRVVRLFDERGMLEEPPLAFRYAYVRVRGRNEIVPSRHRLDSTPHNVTWNLELDRELKPHVLVRLNYLSSRTYDQFFVEPLRRPQRNPTILLSNTGGSRYHEFESTLRLRPTESADLNFSYVRSLARGDLNTLSELYVPFQEPVIRPNFFGTLPSNVPNRFISWARFKLPREITAGPVFDVHSGFPYSALDVRQNYVGAPNSLRLPAFASLDVKLTKDLRVPLLPWLKNHKFRVAFTIFNITNHSNPRDVFNNVSSPFFGNFVGFQHRFYDAYLDIVY